MWAEGDVLVVGEDVLDDLAAGVHVRVDGEAAGLVCNLFNTRRGRHMCVYMYVLMWCDLYIAV